MSIRALHRRPGFLRYRLLRQPGGFEGFIEGVVLVDLRDLAWSTRAGGGPLPRLRPRYPTSPSPPRGAGAGAPPRRRRRGRPPAARRGRVRGRPGTTTALPHL